MSFHHHTIDIHRRCQQRLSVIRKLRSLSVKPHLLLLLYRSIIEPVLLYCATCYFTILSLTNRNKLLRITKTSSKIIGLPTPNLPALIDAATIRRANTIIQNPSHPLNSCFTLLPSGRRYRQLHYKKSRLGKSFVISAIRALNLQKV